MATADPTDLQAIDRIRARVVSAKSRIGGVDWYPYDSLASLREAAELAAAGEASLSALVRDASVLELGAGDGHGAFLAEELGARHVTTVDWPSTNFNQMQGVTRLAEALGSRVDIQVADIDAGFAFPGHRFNLCLALGLLYHLKNPVAFLENIRKCSWRLLLSTAVVLPQSETTLPAAYLVDETEENADPTNYWLLTPRCVERLLARTGWTIVATRLARESGARANFSNGRFFVFARAGVTDPIAGLDAPAGWHELEENRYRWTERSFGFAVAIPTGARSLHLKLQLLWPEISLRRFGPLQVTAALPALAGQTHAVECSEPTWLEFVLPVPESAPPHARVEIRLNHALPPEESDPRERGVAVDSLAIAWE